MQRSIRLALVAVVAALLCAVAAGCGSDDKSDSSASAGSAAAATTTAASDAAPAAAGDDLKTKAAAKVAEFEKKPTEWPGPTEAFTPGTGKAAAMACAFSAPVCAANAKEAVTAFKAIGWDASPAEDGQFSPQVQAAFLDRAVQQKLDAVLLVSIDLDTIKSAVQRAIKAGVMIGCTMCVAPDEYVSTGKVFDGTVDFTKQGEMDAWAVMARSGEDAKVVHWLDKAFKPLPLRLKGFQDTLKANCSKCSFEVRQFASASIAKPGPPEFTAMLSSKPPGTITDNIAHYDGAGMAMAKTTKQRGRSDFMNWGYDGSVEGVTALAKGEPPYGGTASEPYTYAEWAVVDQIARAKAGKPEWEGLNQLPSQLITKNNASDFLNPYSDPTPPGDWRAAFKKLWGTS